MVFIPVGFGLLVHILFWGAGLACLLTPRPWRRWWPVFAAPAGVALQSTVVWLGAYAGLPGTGSYAWAAELLPAALLGAAAWRAGAARLGRELVAWRWLGLTSLAVLAALLAPMEQASPVLTTSSLGSCDAADYAAGARVLQDFGRGDRTGFLGLTEVVRIESVDNFYDFWLRLNHFSPSALIALNGAVFALQPYQLTGVMTAVLVALAVPGVFWLARAGLRYSPAGSLWLAAIYALNPLTWYAVAHVAMGQLLAAQAIALLTWIGLAAWRGRGGWRRGAALAGLAAVAWSILLGAYNFMTPVALVPALAYAGGEAMLRGEWRKLGAWLVVLLAPLAAAGGLYLDRVLGLAERYQLLRENDFGWAIPALTPEGWLGAVAGSDLSPLGGGLARIVLLTALGALLVLAIRRGRGAEAFTAAALTIPVAIGYGFLEWRGAQLGTNASYNAYKLLAVFLPGVLAGICLWTNLARRRPGWPRIVALAAAAGVTFMIAEGSGRFMRALRRAPLTVDRDLVQLQELETRPGVTSLNLRIPDMWSRLWANAFLLRRPQYFATHTYEGRRNTELRGEWDLLGGVIATRLPANGSVQLNPGYLLVDTRSPYRIDIQPVEGWHELEQSAREKRRWRWTSGRATLFIANSSDRPIRTHWKLRNVESLVPRQLDVLVDGRPLLGVAIGTAGRDVLLPGLVVPPGGMHLTLATPGPLSAPGGGDTRLLGFRVFAIEVDVDPASGSGGSVTGAFSTTWVAPAPGVRAGR